MTSAPPIPDTLDREAVAEWRERAAVHCLGFGLAAAALAVLPAAPSDLDRFQLPKELATHLGTWTAVMLARPHPIRWPSVVIRAALALLLLASALGTALATNPWLGLRATALTMTAAVGFLLAHHLGAAQGRTLAAWAVAGVTLGATTAWAQAWGAESVLFAATRAPGGTFGNRNFVGHLAAIVLPGAAILLCTAPRAWRAAVATLAIGALVGILLLTRSRAAWLGAVAGGSTTALALVVAWRRGGLPLPWPRLAMVGGAAVLGAVLAFGVPNTLAWRSESPYRDTLTGVANFQEGSGRGRLVQYRHTLALAAREPVVGVGPGNWPIRYGDVAPASDPSWTFGDVIPLNPWPSSDWMAVASERGAAGLLAVLLLAAGLAWRGWRGVRGGGMRGAAGAALLGTLAATAVTGAFDAVLLLPVPALAVAMLAGGWLALADGPGAPPHPGTAPGRARRWWPLAALLVALAAARSAQQVAAYAVAGSGRDRTALRWAARLDPTSYPIRIALAQRAPCRDARPHIAAVRRLAPTWPAVAQVARRCR